MPAARDGHGGHSRRPGAVQGGLAQRPCHQRVARVRGLRQARRCGQPVGQGRAGTGCRGIRERTQGRPFRIVRERIVSRFFLTTAIDYVNSQPHLGTAYEKVMADVIARYKRLCGVETYFLMGNDEHSQNVFRKAHEEGVPPLEYCDRMEQEFRTTWQALNLSFDDFIRTTEPRHKAGVTYLAQ